MEYRETQGLLGSHMQQEGKGLLSRATSTAYNATHLTTPHSAICQVAMSDNLPCDGREKPQRSPFLPEVETKSQGVCSGPLASHIYHRDKQTC